jgi:hypothetical protein
MRIVYLSGLCVLFAGSLLAQNETAVLSGRVLDPAGLGVVGTDIRLTETTTGAVRTTLSTAGGFYRFDLLSPGDYSIRAAANGFQAFEDSGFHLDVARSSLLDIHLSIGAVSTLVQVTAGISPLVTASAAQGTVISSEKVTSLLPPHQPRRRHHKRRQQQHVGRHAEPSLAVPNLRESGSPSL